MITWNKAIKFVISDFDETIADVYTKATDKMIKKIELVLERGIIIMIISGQGYNGIYNRLIHEISKPLRKNILIGQCSGAEVFGFDENGNILEVPYYSQYEKVMNEDSKVNLRTVIEKLISEFQLTKYPVMPVTKFAEITKGDPFSIMYDDRTSQVTLEFFNSYNMSEEIQGFVSQKIPLCNEKDLRVYFQKRAAELLNEFSVPVTARCAGEFAIDFAVANVSKTTAVKYVIDNRNILLKLGLEDITSSNIEIWGDKFSTINGGTDRYICEALPMSVRAIDFRKESISELPEGFNIVLWDGEEQLHNGLLEYLSSEFK